MNPLWFVENWKLCVLGALAALAGFLYMRLDTMTAERDLARANLAEYKNLADIAAKAAKKQSDVAKKELEDAIPGMVAAAQDNAYKNYRAKFGACNSAGGFHAVGLSKLPASLDGAEAGVPAQGDGVHQPEPVVTEESTITACGVDAGYIELIKHWAVTNDLKISAE